MDPRSASSLCPCGSGLPFNSCHGLPVGEETLPSVPKEETRTVTHGYWLVAFVDLLGQKDAFLKTDYLPNASDPAKVAAFISEVQAGVGAIRGMRKILDSFRTGMQSATDSGTFTDLSPEKRELAERLQRTEVRAFRMSDGYILACPLMRGDKHFPIRGAYEVLATCAMQMLAQLVAGRPIRGGLDVGTGMEVDGELFGAGLVKAYVLESNYAGGPRLVVGDDLVGYLRSAMQSPMPGVEEQFERNLAASIMQLLKRDTDDRWVLDYAGQKIRELVPGIVTGLGPAREFARRSRAEFQARTDPEGRKLFERYSMLVRHLEASG